MKLIIQNNRIVATATDAYAATGSEQAVLDAPAGFDMRNAVFYTIGANGTLAVGAVFAADKAALIHQVDADVDTLYDQAVGNRGPEYEDALSDAQAFKATGYTSPVPASVQSWSTISGLSLQAAADNVIASAASLKAAQTAIRTQRLTAKQAARVATTQSDLDAVKAQWSGFLKAVRTQLGI